MVFVWKLFCVTRICRKSIKLFMSLGIQENFNDSGKLNSPETKKKLE